MVSCNFIRKYFVSNFITKLLETKILKISASYRYQEQKLEETEMPDAKSMKKAAKVRQMKAEKVPKKRPKLADEEEDDFVKPIFYVENGIRNVKPYWSEYKTHAKGRWVGRKIVEVFEKEFVGCHPSYMVVATKLGRFKVNGQAVNVDYVIKNNDYICHYKHRHESPVLDAEIEILEDGEDLLIVNKPASLPVHACGSYRALTVVGLLHRLHGYLRSQLRVLHRLDRTTSGLLLFAKNYEADVRMKKSLVDGQWEKEYVCKVQGVFPSDEVVCKEAIGPLSLTMGIQCVQKEGKTAETMFRLGWTDGHTSVVYCFPKTGRTHQIRVHLQYLGYPIVDDQIYNDDVWGPNKGKNAEYGKSFEQLRADVHETHSAAQWHVQDSLDGEYSKRMETIATSSDTVADLTDTVSQMPDIDPICRECHVVKKEIPRRHFAMFLHCLKYKMDGKCYATALPEWTVQPAPPVS